MSTRPRRRPWSLLPLLAASSLCPPADAAVIARDPSLRLGQIVDSGAPLHPSQSELDTACDFGNFGNIESIGIDRASGRAWIQIANGAFSTTTCIFEIDAISGAVSLRNPSTGFRINGRGTDLLYDPGSGFLVTGDGPIGSRLMRINPNTGVVGTYAPLSTPLATLGLDVARSVGGSDVPGGHLMFTTDESANGVYSTPVNGPEFLHLRPPIAGDDMAVQPDGDWVHVEDFDGFVRAWSPLLPHNNTASSYTNVRSMFNREGLSVDCGTRASVDPATGDLFLSYSCGQGGSGIVRLTENLQSSRAIVEITGSEGLQDLVVGPATSGNGNSVYFTVHDLASRTEEVWEIEIEPAAGCRSDADCDDQVECTDDVCDQQSGECSNLPDDSLCDDDVECTADSCDPSQGCVHQPDDGACSDGVFCNGQELCNPQTGCRPGQPPSCDDGVACTADSCDTALDECVNDPSACALLACFGFQPDPAPCRTPTALDASCSESEDPGDPIILWEWDLDDDGQFDDASGEQVDHVFGSFGVFSVSLRVTTASGREDVASQDVEVSADNGQPLADADGPYEICAGDELQLDGSGSSEPDADCGDEIVSYEWDLDADGQFDDASGPQPLVPWPQLQGLPREAPLPVALRVTDSLGLAATGETTLLIHEDDPVAAIDSEPNPATCDDEVMFDASASFHPCPQRSIVSYSWDFGDGSPQQITSVPTVGHFYTQDGLYTVSVTVSDDDTPPKTATASLEQELVNCNQPPVADAGGPYAEECAGLETGVQLDGSGSSDPDGDPISYAWETDCPGSFDDPTSAAPVLTVQPPQAPCLLDCSVSLTVTDPRQASDSQTAPLRVEDTLDPTLDVSGPSEVRADENCLGLAEFDVAMTDCRLATLWVDSVGDGVFDQTFDYLCAVDSADQQVTASGLALGLDTLLFRAEDCCGHATERPAQVRVVDETAPAFDPPLPQDRSAECDAVPPAAELSASDNCDPDVEVELDETREDGSCPDRYTLTRVWTATDDAGNQTTHSQTVDVDDTTPPTLTPPADLSVECDQPTDPSNTGQAAASDNCDGSPLVSHSDAVQAGSCPQERIITRTWRAEDACGNVAASDQLITVEDTTAPVLQGVPPDATVECDAVPPPATPTASDNCDPQPAIGFDEQRVDGNCPGNYTLLRTWTASDACGNGTSDSQTLSVVDTTPPQVTASGQRIACLWPPNHRWVCFGRDALEPELSDACSEPVEWEYASCSSSQPPDSGGDGSTEPDCWLAPDGQSFCVRAERAGDDEAGRDYSIGIVATDACGNQSDPTVAGTVHVPHDRKDVARDECINAASQGCREGEPLPCGLD